ncbi:hypothetical protein JCM3765_006406 [Sporobolomyces pararoseus]
MSSTTAQPPSTATEGECVVCGKICSTRCSSCSKHGLEWMYFCSVEHQRLIWFAHKKTCGENANPFQWPLLDENGREECRKLKDEEYKNTSGEVVTFQRIVSKAGMTFERMMDVAAGKAKSTQQQRFLTIILAFLFSQRQDRAEKELSTSISPELRNLKRAAQAAQDPYGYLAQYLDLTWDELRLLDKENYQWYSELHHRLLILSALICRNYQNPEFYLDHADLVKYAVDQVVEIIDDRVSKDRPEEAQTLRALTKTASFNLFQDPRTGRIVGLVHIGNKE